MTNSDANGTDPPPGTRTGDEPGTHPSAVAARLYAALAAGDTTTVADLVHPDAVLSVPGDNPISGEYRGFPGLAQFTAAAERIAPGGARTEVVDIMDSARHAVVYGITRATRPGRPPLLNLTLHLLVITEGQVSAVTVVNQDQPAVDAFWS